MGNIDHLIDKTTYKYKQAGKAELGALRSAFLVNCCIQDIFKQNLEYRNVGVCGDTVAKIIEQVRRRKLYFHIYHDVNGLSESKETALYAFWILKLQPFFWKANLPPRLNYKLNAQIALGYFFRGLNLYADKLTLRSKGIKQYKTKIYANTLENTIYSFIFRDISKEALMDLAESLIIEVPIKNNTSDDNSTVA
jgi:hypothetical protein